MVLDALHASKCHCVYQRQLVGEAPPALCEATVYVELEGSVSQGGRPGGRKVTNGDHYV